MIKMVLKPEMNCKNKITATGVLAVPVLRHSQAITDCKFEETQKIDRRTGKMETVYRMFHHKGDIVCA